MAKSVIGGSVGQTIRNVNRKGRQLRRQAVKSAVASRRASTPGVKAAPKQPSRPVKQKPIVGGSVGQTIRNVNREGRQRRRKAVASAVKDYAGRARGIRQGNRKAVGKAVSTVAKARQGARQTVRKARAKAWGRA